MRRDDLTLFNPWGEIAYKKNRLPHWQQRGATYFVTWRLADSIPKEILNRHFEERAVWLRYHPEPWDEETESEFHRQFSGKLEEPMDRGHGECLLRNSENARALAETLRHFDGERIAMISFVIMPNHVHLLFALHPEQELGKIIQSWKRRSARVINLHEGRKGSLWQKDYFDRLIRDATHFGNCVRYIRRNPDKAKLSKGQFVIYESEVAKSIE